MLNHHFMLVKSHENTSFDGLITICFTMMRSQKKIVPAKARNRSGAAWMT